MQLGFSGTQELYRRKGTRTMEAALRVEIGGDHVRKECIDYTIRDD